MLQHVDGIRDFYENTNYDHCLIVEDDIHISKELTTDIQQIKKDFSEMNLDVLMLGCILVYKLDMNTHLHKAYFPIVNNSGKYSYHNYPDDIWGSHLYMISRTYAKMILEKFSTPYTEDSMKIPYNPDMILTKVGKRALLNPMLAIEERRTDGLPQNYNHDMLLLNHFNENFV
jgi:GR25 family glycosyltransferase involved in LPS biosynthesis